MQILVNRPVQSIMGEDLKEPLEQGEPCPTCARPQVKTATVMMDKVIINALLGQYEDERTLAGAEKLKRWQLAGKIKNFDKKGMVELDIEEAKLAKDLINKAYGTMIAAPVSLMLEEGKESPQDKDDLAKERKKK